MFNSSSRSPQRQAARQRHYLVPTLRRVARVHVVDDDHAAIAVGRRRRCVDTRGGRRSEVEQPGGRHDKFVAFHVVVAEKVLDHHSCG